MYRYFFLIYIVVILYLSSWTAFKIFFPLKKGFRRHTRLFSAAGIPILLLFCLLMPLSFFRYVSVLPPILLLLVCLIFFQGHLREKLTVFVVFYLTLLFTESVTVFLLYVIHFLTAGKFPVCNMLFLNAGIPVLTAYIILYSAVLIPICHKVVPVIKQYLDILMLPLFLRLAGPYLATYMLTNCILLFLSSDSQPVRLFFSLLYFAAIFILSVYAFRNIRIFAERERERTILHFRKQQLEHQLQRSEILSRQYMEVKKNAHDISSHLTAIRFLIDSGKRSEAQKYIRSILKQREVSEK